MTPRAASRIAWGLWLVIPIVVVAGVLIIALTDFTVAEQMPGIVFVPIFLFAFATVGALVASRRPGNAIGWIMLGTGVAWAVAGLGDTYAGYAAQAGRTGSFLARLADWPTLWFYIVGLFLPITLLLLLFPTGSPLSPRWRAVVWIAVIGNTLLALALAFAPGGTASDTRFLRSNPFGIEGAEEVVEAVNWVGWWAALGTFVFSAIGIGVRLRRARGDERAQLKWLATSGCVVVLVMIVVLFVGSALGWEEDSMVLEIVVLGSLTVVPVSAGIAILKHRLYDIDLVINKTLVYGILAGFVTLVFLALVVGLGTLAGGTSNTFLAAVAAAVVALVFQPVRRWAQRLANRLVYGERATPYEVLSGFSERLSETYSVDDVLPRLARVLAEGIGAARVAVLLRQGDRRTVVAEHPTGGSTDLASSTYEVKHQGTLLGEIEVVMSPGESLDPAREKLVRDVAAQAGLVLRNAALIEDLKASRVRLVAAQNEERRRIERNIHDGAQQQLVALAVKLRLADTLVGSDEERAHAMLAELQTETNQALEDLRDLARGIYPPLLADKGLPAALESQARKSAVPVSVESEGIGRYPQEAEAAVYFSCLEALQNIAKYANASAASIRLVQTDSVLMFQVSDDGRGFDPAAVEPGTGLQGVADRLAALGGTLDIRSAPDEGATLVGRIPVGTR